MPTLRAFITRLRERWTDWRSPLPADLTREQLAALVADAWSGPPQYATTQPRALWKARQTFEVSMRRYLGRHQGWFATIGRVTRARRSRSSRDTSLQKSA